MKDSLYLKKYVEMHPDNKMGWYLLGKDYEKNGEEGKANYCFNQSGEVYEAFELSKAPDDLWLEYQYRLLQLTHDKERRTNKIRIFLLAIVMMLLVFTPTINAPGNRTASNVKESVNEQQSELAPSVNHKQVSDTITPLFTAQAAGSSQERARSLSYMLAHPGSLPVNMVVLGMERQDKWLLWKRSMPIAFTLKKNEDSAVTYQSYDPEECDCKPSEDPKLKISADAWIKEQEDLLVLSQAIRSFAQQEGRVPVSLSEMVQPFPRNVLSGSTEIMKSHLGKISAAYTRNGMGKGKDSSASVQKKGDTSPSPSALATAIGDDVYFKDPIEVIVDKKNYRLAVVSGNIMLRNYKVGLGGAKTPEDEFVITDKVVNPNGSSNGEFGSRGMQLSASRYAIHGTDEPESIGRDESNGCIRMSKEDVEELFDLIPMGTKVRIGKGVLPVGLLVPTDRYETQHRQDQTNPHKTYRWLN